MKKAIIILTATTLCISISLHGMSSSSAESNFSRQWGAMGTLHQAPTYYKPYVPEKGSCCKKQQNLECFEQQYDEEDESCGDNAGNEKE